MAYLVLIMFGILLNSSVALACDDHVGKCEVEAWRVSSTVAGMMMIDGVATCNSGRITMRLYDDSGKKDRFLGVADGLIEGHAFTSVAMNVAKPKSLSMKYSIMDPRN